MEKLAHYIKRLDGFSGTAELYRMSPPLLDYDGTEHEFVAVSATVAPFSGPETYIFPADEEGNVTGWGELPGSCRGTLDIEGVLEGEGYVVSRED